MSGVRFTLGVFFGDYLCENYVRDSLLLDCWFSDVCLWGCFSSYCIFLFLGFLVVGAMLWHLCPGLC